MNDTANNTRNNMIFMNLIIIFFIFIVSFIFISNFKAQFYSDKITATITNILSDGDDSYNVYVDYTYEGLEYNDILLNSYNSEMHVGNSIELYVNRDNPLDIKVVSNTLIYGIILAILLVVFALFNLGFFSE